MAVRSSQLDNYIKVLATQVPKQDWTKTMKKIRLVIIGMIRRCFVESRDPAGNKWKPLQMQRPRGGNLPLRDRGILMASMTTTGPGHYEKITSTSIEIGSNLPQAPTHQYGAVIKPKRGKFLAIPRTRQAVNAGSPKRFPGLVAIIGSKGGVLVKKGPKGANVVHYALVKSVTIPARPYAAWSQEGIDKAAQILADDAGQGFVNG